MRGVFVWDTSWNKFSKSEMATSRLGREDFMSLSSKEMIDIEFDDLANIQYEFAKNGTAYSVTGDTRAPPIKEFNDPSLSLDSRLLANLVKANYESPTLIQQLGMPQVVEKLDMMCCSYTGTGKTGTYLIPLLNTLIISRSVGRMKRESYSRPGVLVLVPTRELAEQVAAVSEELAVGTTVKSLAVYGGDSLGKELSILRSGKVDVLVATPGRLIHLLDEFSYHRLDNSRGILKLDLVKYLVIDEADEMFDRGFFPQINTIIDCHMGPLEKRTNIMFSATFPRQIQFYAKKNLKPGHVFLVVGMIGGACPGIRQKLVLVYGMQKMAQLSEELETHSQKKILIFCNTIEKTDFITTVLQNRGLRCASIHSGHAQTERDQALRDFNTGNVAYLVATSVASRGLNVVGNPIVINYDLPQDINDYVQRIGRAKSTGLDSGGEALAISFFDEDTDMELINALVLILRDARQRVPAFLLDAQRRLEEKTKAFAADYQNCEEDLLRKFKKIDIDEDDFVESPDWWG